MNEEVKNHSSAKAVCVCALLVTAGIAGGFAVGRMTGGAVKEEQPQPVVKEKVQTDDAKKLAKAQKRIAELERDLADAKASAKRVKALALKAENSVSNLLANSTSSVSVMTNADVEAELKRQLPEDAYHEATNALSRLRAKLAERAKGRYDYISAVDVSHMSKSDRENHKKFLSLLEKREAIRAKATGIIPNPAVLQELVELDMSMQKVAKQERSALVREVVRELGYSGDDVDVVHDTLVNVFDSTSGGGLNSLFEAASDMVPGDGDGDGGGEPKVKVGVETHVIGM